MAFDYNNSLGLLNCLSNLIGDFPKLAYPFPTLAHYSPEDMCYLTSLLTSILRKGRKQDRRLPNYYSPVLKVVIKNTEDKLFFFR